jgi:hypothetical protein
VLVGAVLFEEAAAGHAPPTTTTTTTISTSSTAADLGADHEGCGERLEAVHEVLLLHAVLEPRALEGVQEVPALQLRLHRRERADLARPRIELHLQQDGTERKK